MPQEDEEDMFAFQEWKKKWDKEYATPNEEKTRFENFKENLRTELVNGVPLEPLWTLLNQYADLTWKEHYGCIRLDYNAISDIEEDIDEDMYPDVKYVLYWPVKQEDGIIRLQDFYPPGIHFDQIKFVQEELQRQRAEKEDTKKVDQDVAVKHQSTVPPVKCSSDDKDDTKEEDQDGTVKRQKIGSRFSPDDKFSRQRVILKKRFGLLPTQQPPRKY